MENEKNSNIVYLRLTDRIQSKNECIYVSDVATVVCADKRRKKVIDALLVLRFQNHMNNRQIVGILWIIQKIQERYPDADIHMTGTNDVIVEYIGDKQNITWMKKDWFQNMKIIFVALISLFGGAFTIMAFHNDIGISELFMGLYEMLTGEKSNGYTLLEISYSIGLALGIILFFNHVGKRRITKDPTPIEVAMRMYENDVNTTLAQTWEREGKNIDAS